MQLYQIVFSGEVAEGWPVDTVKKNFAKLFKADHKVIATLFSGHPVVIKQAIDHDSAIKYIATLASVGGICRAQPIPTADQPLTEQQIKDQRRDSRRQLASRRQRERLSSIQPDRRLKPDRRRAVSKLASDK